MIEVTAAVIAKDGKYLICQRPEGKNCALLWEFPGGKIEPGESAAECIVRECREELNITLKVQCEIAEITHDYPDRTVHLRFFSAEVIAGEPECREHNALAWVTPSELNKFQFCPADERMLKIIHMR